MSCDQSNRRQTEEDQPPGFAGWLGKANEDNCVTLTMTRGSMIPQDSRGLTAVIYHLT